VRELLDRIHRLIGPLPSGLTDAELAGAEVRLGAPLPVELLSLYRDHDGTPASVLPMRLMRMAEVLDTNGAIRREWPDLLPDGAAVFWTDDNSNYAGAFLSGGLSPRVFTLDHEEPGTTPTFRSARTFVTELLAGAERDGDGLTPDYPSLVSRGDPSQQADRELGESYLQVYLHDATDTAAAFVAIALLPPEDTGRLVPLLKSTDMWVQEQACRLMGLRRYADAVEQLVDVVRGGMHNGRIAAIGALRRISTRRAAEALRVLQGELGRAYEPYFRNGTVETRRVL